MENHQRLVKRKRRWYPDGRKAGDCKADGEMSNTQDLHFPLMAAESLLSKGQLNLSVLAVLCETYVGKFPSPNPLP